MNNESRMAEDVFDRALQIPIGERAAFVLGACSGDEALKGRVEALLSAHEQDSRFLPGGDTIETVTSDVPASEETGMLIGRYKLLEKLGEGGFGSVWAAEQREPVKRRVALKIIKLGMDTKQVVARFEAERQALALMDHPNIAKVLDAGTTETGRPYFVMELVKGIPITKYFEQEATEVEQKLKLFIRVCQAIQHAHQKGIIHRDIKPSNVMVTLHDGEPVPKVIDFGIAKATQGDLTDKTIYTQYSQFIGTPAYMSPEQAEMSGLDIDTRSDIYSLGVLLYELLTGATPFDARELMQSGIDEMRRIIREQEPVRPSTKLIQTQTAEMTNDRAQSVHPSSSIDRDLDWIVLKCLEKDRSRRYDTAAGLAADIHRHLDHKPVYACPPSVLYQFTKLWRRNRVALTGACAAGLSLSIGLTVSVWQGYQKTIESRAKDVAIQGQTEALEEAQKSKAEAENYAEEARGNLYAADMKAIQRYLEDGNLGTARELLDNHIPEDGKEDLRGWEWRYFWKRAQGDQIWQAKEHRDRVGKIQFSPDNRHLVSLGDRTGELIVWDWIERKRVRTRLFAERVRDFKISFDGQVVGVLVGEGPRRLELWDAELRQMVGPKPLSDVDVRAFHFSPDGSEIYFSDLNQNGKAFAWDLSTNERRELFDGVPTGLWDVSEDGRLLGLQNQEKSVAVWDFNKGGEVRKFRDHRVRSGRFQGYRMLASGDGVLWVGYARPPRILDRNGAHSVEPLHTIFGVAQQSQFAISEKHNLLATASYNHNVNLWSLDRFERLEEFYGHGTEVWCVDISPDGRCVASGGMDGEVMLWSAAPRSETTQVQGRFVEASPVFSPDGRFIALSAAGSGLIRILNLEDREEAYSFSVSGTPIGYSSDGTELLVLGESTVDYLDATTGSLTRQLSLKFRPDSIDRAVSGNLLALTDEDRKQVRVIRLSDGEERFVRQVNGLDALAISADGKHLAVASSAGDPVQSIEVWDLESETLLWKRDAHSRWIEGLEFSPDGERLASFSIDSTIGIWDLKSGEGRGFLKGGKRGAFHGTFSPDGATLVSSNSDRTVKLWQLKTGREVASFHVPKDAKVTGFSPDGRFLVAYGGPQAEHCYIWEAPMINEIQ